MTSIKEENLFLVPQQGIMSSVVRNPAEEWASGANLRRPAGKQSSKQAVGPIVPAPHHIIKELMQQHLCAQLFGEGKSQAQE